MPVVIIAENMAQLCWRNYSARYRANTAHPAADRVSSTESAIKTHDHIRTFFADIRVAMPARPCRSELVQVLGFMICALCVTQLSCRKKDFVKNLYVSCTVCVCVCVCVCV
jgi:hypothetical protein